MPSRNELERKATFEKYMSGLSVAYNQNSKGLYELFSNNGKSLYVYDYLFLKKEDIKINNKSVLFWNVFPYIPLSENGTPMVKHMSYIKSYIINKNLYINGAFKDYQRIYICSDKDMTTFNLNGYSQELTQTIYNLIGDIYGTSSYIENFVTFWGNNFQKEPQIAHNLLQHYNLLNAGATTPYRCLSDINTTLRWKAINEVVNYWMANNFSFSEDDDKRVPFLRLPIRAAYMALGGKEFVFKDINKEKGIAIIRILSPYTPINEIPLYISIDNDTIKTAVRMRLNENI